MTIQVQHNYLGHSSLLSALFVQTSCILMPPAGHLVELSINTSASLLSFSCHKTSVWLMIFCHTFAFCSCRSALQVLHKACEVSRRFNYFPGGIALTWMAFYESCITSEQSYINEWNAMTDLETTRPDSPTMFVDG